MGIEPTQSAWKAEVLPLNYTRKNGAQGRNRTGTDFKVRRILSPVRLPISPPGLIQLNGDPQATRTPDPLIKSQMLYQLSQRVIPYGWGSWIRTSAMTESKSVALPLGYTPMNGGGGRIRTTEPKELSYSQPRLATSLPPHHWCRLKDLNPQPTDYKSVALPIELSRRIKMVEVNGLEPLTLCL